jgi:hypothetical protein
MQQRANISEHDIRCSNACTRAGIAALLLSVVAIAMLQPLDKRKQLDSVVKYVLLRAVLQEDLNKLDTDQVWKFLKSTELGEQATKEWTLAKLLEYKIKDDGSSSFQYLQPSEQNARPVPNPPPQSLKKSSAPSKDLVPPAAPILSAPVIFIDRSIQPLHSIANALEELGNGEMLTRARQYSHQYDRSIYRWAILRYRIIMESKSKTEHILWAEPEEKSHSERTIPYVPNVPREDLLKHLTFLKTAELITHEPPDQSEADALLRDQANLTLPSVGVLVPLAPAATFVEISLVLLAVYFALYYREAKVSASFPAPATLFGVFSRTRLSRGVFSVLLLVPPVAAALLAQKSFWITSANVVPAVLIVLIAYMIRCEGTPSDLPPKN